MVVLPEPLGPMSATCSRGWTSSDRSFSTSSGPKLLHTSLNRMIGSLIPASPALH